MSSLGGMSTQGTGKVQQRLNFRKMDNGKDRTAQVETHVPLIPGPKGIAHMGTQFITIPSIRTGAEG